MGTIRENLERVHAAVVVDKFKKLGTNQEPFGDQLGKVAVKAITNGITSQDWKDYMSFFADNVAQLKLLTEPQQTEETYLPQARAYIVSNAVCGAGTNTNTGINVNTDLGATLAGGSDGLVNKLFPIPDLT